MKAPKGFRTPSELKKGANLMSVTVIADLAIKPEEVEWVITTLLSVLPNTRKAEGCLDAELQRNQDDPNNLLIVQEFETRDHYLAYLNSLGSEGDPDGVMERYFAAFERPAEIRYYDHL